MTYIHRPTLQPEMGLSFHPVTRWCEWGKHEFTTMTRNQKVCDDCKRTPEFKRADLARKAAAARKARRG